MKRLLSLLLALCLALALSAPALAETEPMDEALAAITARVKELLDVDDGYTSFYSSYNDGLRPGWYLSWSDDGRDLSVTCTEDGVVTDVSFWRSGERDMFYGFDAALPALGETEARAIAQDRLERLMGEGELARIDSVDIDLRSDGSRYFTGRILMNGLESPVTFGLRVNSDGELTSYTRSDGYKGYVGGVPSAGAQVDRKTASAALRDAVETALYYVTDAATGQARLRYVPVGPYTVVDAVSGETVDMDALYASFGGRAGGPEAPMAAMESGADAGGARGLTEVELSSIAGYADVRDRKALDAALRTLPGAGLDGFSLDRCSYAMDADGVITASLRYSAPMTEERLFGFSYEDYADMREWNDDPTVTKYITVDAKSGELISLSTSYPLWRASEPDEDSETARAFLAAAAPGYFSQSAPCTLAGFETDGGVRYARTHGGYFFPENYLCAEVNEAENAVDTYYRVWDDEARFAPSEGITDEAAAQAAYVDALTVTLGYAAWPEGIDYDDPVLMKYADWGYTFVESLRLAWYYGGTADVSGVDALTGEPVVEKADGSYAYGDLDGVHEREMIEALGAAGVGFAGSVFQPTRTLTQREALTLLLQAAGYDIRRWDDGTLKSEAVRLGFLREGEWAPEESVSEAGFARMLLRASRYGAAAELTGVWADGFDDGYAAVAAGLGMTADAPLSDAPCTRADAAALLYRFMAR